VDDRPAPPLLEFDAPAGGRLVVGSGETVVLLGPSGSGKTTLVRGLLGVAGAAAPTGLRLRGRPARPQDVAALAGWVPDADGVFLDQTVWDNVARPPYLPPLEAEPARDALDLVGLAGRASEPVTGLSRHARRRVALARAFAMRRPLLIVDGELDPALWALFPGVVAQAPGVEAALLATAGVGERAALAHSCALVADGRIVAQAPLAELSASSDPDVRGVLAWVTP
jgi:ABC-type multidrug transport system ATPase subunit